MKKRKDLMQTTFRNEVKSRLIPKLVPVIISVLLFFTPILFWGDLYIVGGDDTRLYYLFPDEMLRNYAFNIVSNNTFGTSGGYLSSAFFAPFLVVFSILKRLVSPVNVQMLAYGLNMACGFLFFYLLMGLTVKEGSLMHNTIRAVSALVYILSIYLIRTVYDHQLLAVYIVGYFPAVMFLLISGIMKGNIWRTILAAFVYSLFSGTMLTLPWFGAAVFSVLPALLFIFFRYRRTAFLHIAVFVAITVSLNISWLSHQAYPFITRSQASNILTRVTSREFKQNNIDLIQALSHLNEPINQFAGYLRSSWSDRLNLQAYHGIGLIYIVTVILAGFRFRLVSGKLQGLYLGAVGILLWTMTLVTPNFGDWNVQLFTFFNNSVPLFTMFRNMYDKFAFPMAFIYAVGVYISLMVLRESGMKRNLLAVLLAGILSVTLFNARQFLLPVYTDTRFSTRISGNFNPDYLELAEYIRNMREPSRFLWLPLNFPSYNAISDRDNSGHYYFGSSPLQFMARSSDYTGFQSFSTSSDPDMNFRLSGLIREGKFTDAARIFQRMNVKYIIVDHQVIPDPGGSRMNYEGLMESQTPDFFGTVIGDKIMDFGQTYSLHSIRREYENDKLFMTAEAGDVIQSIEPVRFNKISETEYTVRIEDLKNTRLLAFLEPYSAFWRLYLINPESGDTEEFPQSVHSKIFRYGNGYEINPEDIRRAHDGFVESSGDGGVSLNLKLSFLPASVSNFANSATLFSWLLISGILFFRLLVTVVRKVYQK